MNTETIVMCVVALLLGMLLANMLKNVCGCKTVEGNQCNSNSDCNEIYPGQDNPKCNENGECILSGPWHLHIPPRSRHLNGL